MVFGFYKKSMKTSQLSLSIAAVLILVILISNARAQPSATERLFYLTPDVTEASFNKEQLAQIKSHAHSIDIIAPQIYQLDENGVIWGSLDERLLVVAKENKLKVMPLIVNANFNQQQFHRFLQNPEAQERAISRMLALCAQYHFYGLQFDFENIHLNDKSEFTHFFQLAANRLHQNGYVISVAIVPRSSDILYTDYDRWYFENWSGAYDEEALSKGADFITIMSYDRHTNLTTPGPLAAIDWVEKTIQGLLKRVPANKISLGIPNYSGYWLTGNLDPGNISEKYTFRSKEIQMAYSKARSLIEQFKLSLVWQNQWKSSYVMFSNNDKNEYLFIEDAKSFQAKLELAKRYHLRGISVWKLGLEDPAIWNDPNLK